LKLITVIKNHQKEIIGTQRSSF